jgi:4-hydroxy-tetrahydrodipicolinate synthase
MTTALKPGVHCVMATPFTPDESLDEASLESLLNYLIARECDGALILGVLGEADRLSDAERDRIIALSIAHAGDRLQISVGITQGSTYVTRERALAAQAAGAAAVMVSPPPGSSAGPALREHYRWIADGLSIPMIVQDHPTSSGVKMPVEFLAGLAEYMPENSMVKLEEPPTAPKIAKLRELAPSFQIMGGLGGVSLYHELEAGSAGAMTGFALPEVLVGIVRAFHAGDRTMARQRFNAALPLLVFEAQPGAGVGLRKELLKRRGAIAHATVRQPAPTPDPLSLRLLDELLEAAPIGVRA